MSSGNTPPVSNIRLKEESVAPLSVLQLWRTKQPDLFRAVDLKAIRNTLLSVEVAGERDWYRAVTGHAAEAIGVAIRALKSYGMNNPAIDAAVSAALCCALEGDHAARILIISALRRRAALDPMCRNLSTLWARARF